MEAEDLRVEQEENREKTVSQTGKRKKRRGKGWLQRSQRNLYLWGLQFHVLPLSESGASESHPPGWAAGSLSLQKAPWREADHPHSMFETGSSLTDHQFEGCQAASDNCFWSWQMWWEQFVVLSRKKWHCPAKQLKSKHIKAIFYSAIW